jgi:hypothetical protein
MVYVCNQNHIYQDSLCAHEKKLNEKHKRSYMGSFALIIAFLNLQNILRKLR